MEAPEGLEGIPEGYVLQLIKALYGLKQAGRQWYHKLREFMLTCGMKRVESDPHTFAVTKVINKKTLKIVVPIYVDDLFPIGNKELTDDFKRSVPKSFDTSTPCDAHYFLGIRVTRNRSPSAGIQPYICLDQIHFAENLVASIKQFFPSTTFSKHKTVLPAEPIVPNPQPKIKANPCKVHEFQSAVGQLMYLMLATRPDLAYPVGMLARHTANPSLDHEKALCHLVGYLMHTLDYALVYRQPEANYPTPGITGGEG